MDYSRYGGGPQPRKNIHSWKYYNEHFKADQLQQLQHFQAPPPAYKNALQQNFYTKPPFKPPKTKKSFAQRHKKLKRFCDQVIEGFDHYCDTSTLHGLKYVGENRFSKAERIFWLISFLIAVCMAIYFITQLYINYDHSPVTISYSPEVMSVQNIPFPAVTICNLNVALKSRAELIKQYGSRIDNLVLQDLCNSKSTGEDYGTIPWSTMENAMLNFTQRCKEMVVGCKWQGKIISDCDVLINAVLTDDGYCCSFNKLPSKIVNRHNVEDKRSEYPDNVVNWYPEDGYPKGSKDNAYPYRAFGPGVEQGLTLVLDAAIAEYYCSSGSSFGFKALFHTPRESPKMKDLGFLLQPGIEARVAIEVDVETASDNIKAIDYQKRKCFFAFERPLRYYRIYSATNCLLECESNYTQKMCSCVPYYLPRGHDTEICDQSDVNCTDAAQFTIGRYGKEKLACECLPGCSQLTYSPGLQSTSTLLNVNNITSTEFLGKFTQKYFTENMVVVHIFFGTERFQVRLKRAVYTFIEFLSSTGGLLGLFMGFSCLTVVEIIYFLFIRGACVWVQNKHNKSGKKQEVFVNA